MKSLPKIIVRIDDGEEFVLNENGTYSNRCMLPFKAKGHLVNEYSYDILMVNNKGFFKVLEDHGEAGKGRE